METSEFDAVFLKSYSELSFSEKEEMKDLFSSEDEFLQMKMVLNSIQENIHEKDKVLQPSAATKEKLDHLFYQTYQNKGVLWYNSMAVFFINPEKNWYQQNLLRMAAVFAIVLMSLPFLMTPVQPDNKNIAKIEELKQEAMKSANEESGPILDQSPLVKKETQVPLLAKVQDNEIVTFSSKDIELFDFAPIAASDEISKAVTSNHPDGIFNDDAPGAKDLPQFRVKDNLFILDFITASY